MDCIVDNRTERTVLLFGGDYIRQKNLYQRLPGLIGELRDLNKNNIDLNEFESYIKTNLGLEYLGRVDPDRRFETISRPENLYAFSIYHPISIGRDPITVSIDILKNPSAHIVITESTKSSRLKKGFDINSFRNTASNRRRFISGDNGVIEDFPLTRHPFSFIKFDVRESQANESLSVAGVSLITLIILLFIILCFAIIIYYIVKYVRIYRSE